jgi:hypothetical protein
MKGDRTYVVHIHKVNPEMPLSLYFLSMIFMYAKAAPNVKTAEKARTLSKPVGEKGG